MKTDHPIYLYLSTGPEAFRVLTGGQRLDGAYRYSSRTFKGLERRVDGLLEPEGHDGPVYIVEFWGQAVAASGYNLLTKLGLYGEEHPDRDVRGIGIYLRERDAPAYPRWLDDAGGLQTVYLDRFLPEWLEREPDNPYIAVFAPLLLEPDGLLREQAGRLWQTVQQAPLTAEARASLSQVLEFWFFERFRRLSAQEIWAMLNIVTPIQETKAYQSIYAEGLMDGEAKGEARGEARGKAEAKATTLRRLLARRFGELPKGIDGRIAAASEAQLEAWLDGIFEATSAEGLLGLGDSPPR